MTTVSEVKLDERPEMPYLGIRVQTPFKGMFKVVGGVSRELARYFDQHGVQPAGPPFLRYHVIDMAGEMDVEYSIPVERPFGGEGRITKG